MLLSRRVRALLTVLPATLAVLGGAGCSGGSTAAPTGPPTSPPTTTVLQVTSTSPLSVRAIIANAHPRDVTVVPDDRGDVLALYRSCVAHRCARAYAIRDVSGRTSQGRLALRDVEGVTGVAGGWLLEPGPRGASWLLHPGGRLQEVPQTSRPTRTQPGDVALAGAGVRVLRERGRGAAVLPVSLPRRPVSSVVLADGTLVTQSAQPPASPVVEALVGRAGAWHRVVLARGRGVTSGYRIASHGRTVVLDTGRLDPAANGVDSTPVGALHVSYDAGRTWHAIGVPRQAADETLQLAVGPDASVYATLAGHLVRIDRDGSRHLLLRRASPGAYDGSLWVRGSTVCLRGLDDLLVSHDHGRTFAPRSFPGR